MNLKEKIESKTAVVGIMGLGYVGLPLLAAFHRAGFPVLGFDVDERKIVALRKGESYLKHLGPALVSDMVKAGRFGSDQRSGCQARDRRCADRLRSHAAGHALLSPI